MIDSMVGLRRVVEVLVLFSWDEGLCLGTARLEEIEAVWI